MGDVDARVHIYTSTVLGRGRVASLTLGRLHSLYSLYSMGDSLGELSEELLT